MLFDITWPQLVLIGVIALVVIGPKDLPYALRIAGYWFRKARSLSQEVQSSVERMIRESELDELRRELKKATELDVEKEFQKTVDRTGELEHSIKADDAPKPSATASQEAEMSEITRQPSSDTAPHSASVATQDPGAKVEVPADLASEPPGRHHLGP